MPARVDRGRGFIDASVLFAAAYPNTGSARDLLLQAMAGRIEALLSQDVLDGVERNIGKKAPELLVSCRQLLHLIGPAIAADLSREEVWAAEKYVAPQDAAIVAAAIKARAGYLVTYDRKHLLGPAGVAQRSGLAVGAPGCGAGRD